MAVAAVPEYRNDESTTSRAGHDSWNRCVGSSHFFLAVLIDAKEMSCFFVA
jgi:hypothetical protein